MKYFTLLILLIIFSFSGIAQQRMSLDDAISIALKNNYQIIISRNEAEIARNNLTPGNAGFLPRIDVSAGQTYSINNSDKTYQNGNKSKVEGAKGNMFTANASLDWTLFDGMKMFTSYEQLSRLKELSETELKANIENVIASVMVGYYSLVAQKSTVNAAKENLNLSVERLRVINDRLNVGAASQLDVLNAKVDFNTDNTLLINAEETLYHIKIRMNELLARDKMTEFDVDDSLRIVLNLNFDELVKKMNKSNPNLNAAEKNIQISKLNSDIYRSEYYPRIGFSADYNYINSKDHAGFLFRNINSGFTFGLNLSLNLFDGLNTSRKIENSTVIEKTAKTQYDLLQNNLISELSQAYSNFMTNAKIANLEKENILVAHDNLVMSQEKLKLGSFSQLELREAQKNYVAANNRYIQAINQAKINETELMKLCGLLLGK